MPYYARRDGSHRRLFLGESRRGYLPSRRDESRADPDRVRSVLSAGGLRIGKAKAITATARTLAVLVYRTLKDHLVYVDHGADAYDAHDRTRVVRRLTHRAAHLGFGLVNLSTGEVVEGAVSWERWSPAPPGLTSR